MLDAQANVDYVWVKFIDQLVILSRQVLQNAVVLKSEWFKALVKSREEKTRTREF